MVAKADVQPISVTQVQAEQQVLDLAVMTRVIVVILVTIFPQGPHQY